MNKLPSGVFCPNITSHFINAEYCPIVEVCQLKLFDFEVFLNDRLETRAQVKTIRIFANKLNIRMLTDCDTSE